MSTISQARTTTSPGPAIHFTPKYFLGLSGDYSLSDHDLSSHASPSPSPALLAKPAPAVLSLKAKARDQIAVEEKAKAIESEKKEEAKMNRAARREGKRRAWAEAHAHTLPTPIPTQQPPHLSPTPATTAPPNPNPKSKPKPTHPPLPPKIQHLLLPLPSPSALARARVRHRFLTRRHLAGVRDLLRGRRGGLPDPVAVEVGVGVGDGVDLDLEEVLRERLRGLLVARKSVAGRPGAVEEKEEKAKHEEDEEDELNAVEEQITFFEKPVPFFKQRARSPTSSNPIIYPRGQIPSPQSNKVHPTSIEVPVEFIKPKYKPLVIAQAMLRKVLAHPGCMYGLGEGARKWVRRMVAGKGDGEEELERMLRGREGEVVWEEGVGRVDGGDGDGGLKEGEEANVHVFMDHSNIHLTMLNTVSNRYASPTRHSDTETDSHPTRPFQPFTKKYLSLPLLTLLLTRGRSLPPNALHLVASAPLMQNLDQAVRNGWKCAVLQRVEVAKEKGGARKFVREDMARKRKMLLGQKEKNGVSDVENLVTSGGETDTGKKHSIRTAKSEDEQEKVVLPSLDDPTITSRRMREQAVDELLQLKMLQTILVTPPAKIGTIVVCTGDAAPGQFNDLGFLGCTKLAIERGWRVELWSWKKGLSRLWREEAKGARWSRRQFEIMYLDEWVAEVVEEKAE